MARVGLPFIRPRTETVRADVWMLSQGENHVELRDYLNTWDYNTRLELSRNVLVEVSKITAQSNLARGAQLALVVGSFATATWSRERLFLQPLHGDDQQVRLEVILDGAELGGTLELRTAVILATRPQSTPQFSAHLPGSILWEDKHRVRLQGDAPLFPISVVSFERAGFAPNAPWHLAISADLTLPLHASIRLYLNDAAASILAAFANAAAPSDEERALLRMVYADVARVMVEHALNQEELIGSDVEFEPDSLGYALRALLDRYCPQRDPAAARLQRVEHPADFSTELQSKLRLFDA